MANVSVETLMEASTALKNTYDDVENLFIKRCATAVEECGITGTFKAQLDELAATLAQKLKAVSSTMVTLSGNLDSFGADVEGFTSSNLFERAQQTAESVQATQVEVRQRKFQ